MSSINFYSVLDPSFPRNSVFMYDSSSKSRSICDILNLDNVDDNIFEKLKKKNLHSCLINRSAIKEMEGGIKDKTLCPIYSNVNIYSTDDNDDDGFINHQYNHNKLHNKNKTTTATRNNGLSSLDCMNDYDVLTKKEVDSLFKNLSHEDKQKLILDRPDLYKQKIMFNAIKLHQPRNNEKYYNNRYHNNGHFRHRQQRNHDYYPTQHPNKHKFKRHNNNYIWSPQKRGKDYKDSNNSSNSNRNSQESRPSAYTEVTPRFGRDNDNTYYIQRKESQINKLHRRSTATSIHCERISENSENHKSSNFSSNQRTEDSLKEASIELKIAKLVTKTTTNETNYKNNNNHYRFMVEDYMNYWNQLCLYNSYMYQVQYPTGYNIDEYYMRNPNVPLLPEVEQ